MNFREYLASKRSGNTDIKLNQIPTASRVIMPLDDALIVCHEISQITNQEKHKELFQESPKQSTQKKPKQKLQENPKESSKKKPSSQSQAKSSGLKLFKDSTKDIAKRVSSPERPFPKPIKANIPPAPEVVTIDSESEVESEKHSPAQTYLVKPSEIITSFKKKEPAKKWTPKIPENLKDVRRHCDHKPKGGSKVLGTKVVKKPTTSINGPLTGQTFVITGLLKGYDRDQLSEILKKYGAKVTGSVSGKTSCLIHGMKLEDGRHYSEGNKFKKAKELNTTIIDEQQLEEMLTFLMGGKSRDDPIIAANENFSAEAADLPKFESLWTEKYKPKRLKEIVGNVQALEKLVKWLEDWEGVVYQGLRKDIRPVRHGKFDPQLNVNALTALISGPPGVGKTTAARLVSLGLNYKITELNASDSRSRKAILEPLLSCSKSSCLTESAQVVKSILIMDEIDGMCAGDRGGIAALVQVVKQTKIPIICICNERMSPKLKAIGNYSYDIRFSKPNKLQVTNRMMEILHKEGVEADPNTIEQVVEASGCDVRQSLTILEMWSRQNQVLTPASARFGLKTMVKDPLSMIGHFDAAAKLLSRKETKALKHRQKVDLFFIDFDMIPLIIHENYLNAMTNEPNQLKRISLAADSIGLADVINTFMRREKEWTLLPQYAQTAAIEPAMRSGNGVAFPKFPEWFGKFSTQRKNERLLREVRNVMAGLISGDNESVLRDYIPTLYKIIMTPFKKGLIDETVDIMHMYNINPEMLKENMIQLQFGSTTCEEEFKNVPSKDKGAVAKLYNHKFKSSIEKVKKKREREFKDKMDPDIEDEEQNKEESESEESEVELRQVAKGKKKRR